MKIGLVSCVKKKKGGKHKAGELYISPLFKKMMKIAKRECEIVYVLSAKYGLLGLEQEIESYEETLVSKRKKELYEWASRTAQQLKEKYPDKGQATFSIYGGSKYYQYLERLLKKDGYEVTVPTRGLSIGKMLSFLNKKINGQV